MLLISKHTIQTCTTCHSDTTTLTEVHENADETKAKNVKRLKKSKVDESHCLSCHGTWEELASLTSESTVLTDTEGLVVNPHETTTTHNQTNAHKDIMCSSCHVMHEEKDAKEVAPSECRSCHHMGNYVACSTCHE